MTNEADMRKWINDATLGIIDEQMGQSDIENVARDVAKRIMPRLAREAVAKGGGGNETDSLLAVKLLLRNGAIGVAVDSTDREAAGLDKDIILDKHPVAQTDTQRQGYALVIVVNPTVASKMAIADDHDLAVGRVKDVMLEAYDAFSDLNRKGEFIPHYKI